MPKHSIDLTPPPEEESYFVSMTDMMVGLLFIFILMLMYFALQYQKQKENLQEDKENLRNAEDTRTQILEQIEEQMKRQNIKVTIHRESGIIRLPEESLRFPSMQATLQPDQIKTVSTLAFVLNEILPCYAFGETSIPPNCPASPHKLEAVFIEGHTDNNQITGSYIYRDNWDLSVARSVNTFRAIIDAEPALEYLKNADGNYLLSVSGYGEKRPINNNETVEEKSNNRRIDLRLIMATPRITDNPIVGTIQGKVSE